MKRLGRLTQVVSLLTTISILVVMGCQSPVSIEDDQKSATMDDRKKAPLSAQQITNKSSAMTNSNASFPVFHQGFNHSTQPWADGTDPGPTGWCGTVAHQDKNSGEVKPSKGKGYATVEWGPCNNFWTNRNPPIISNAPGSTLDFSLFSSTWPESGFIQQLDIYLDPDEFNEELAFTYANSLNALNSQTLPFQFYYPAINVFKVSGALKVADEVTDPGHRVEESGWYTFRYVFDSDESGLLTVEFQLVNEGQVIYKRQVNTSYFGLTLSELPVSELGSGYCWFPFIEEGVSLPIDEQHLRPGK